jgi:branched-subunit amino acid transport protein AzlD
VTTTAVVVVVVVVVVLVNVMRNVVFIISDFFNHFQHNPAVGYYSKYLKLGVMAMKTFFIT